MRAHIMSTADVAVLVRWMAPYKFTITFESMKASRRIRIAIVALIYIKVSLDNLRKEFIAQSSLAVPLPSNPRNPTKVKVKRRPRLIFHVGPTKTATSAIQCTLAFLEESGRLSDLIAARVVEIESCRPSDTTRGMTDHQSKISQYRQRFPFVTDFDLEHQFGPYVYKSSSASLPERTTYNDVVMGESNFRSCINLVLTYEDSIPDCWELSYKRYIQNYYHGGNDTTFVISNELLVNDFGVVDKPETCAFFFNRMLTSLGNEFEIEIIFAQRFHHDRVISNYYEDFSQIKFFMKKDLIKSPKLGGMPARSIPKYVENYKDDAIVSALKCFRYASNNNSRVHLKVIDFHDKNRNVLTSFFDILSRDESTTQMLLSGTKNSYIFQNIGSSRVQLVSVDRIVFAAIKMSMFPTTAKRKDIRNKLADYLQKKGITSRDMKYVCPAKEFYDDLLEKSIMLQRSVFPDRPKDWIETEISQSFWRAVNSSKYCDVDGFAMIKEDVIQAFAAQYK